MLGIGAARADAFRDAVLGGFESVKPGWTRLNFSWFIEPAEFEFLQAAIEFIADHGERFIAQYHCDWRTGAWQHPLDEAQPGLLALAAQLAPSHMQAPAVPASHADCIARAHALVAALPAGAAAARSLPSGLPAALVSFGH